MPYENVQNILQSFEWFGCIAAAAAAFSEFAM